MMDKAKHDSIEIRTEGACSLLYMEGVAIGRVQGMTFHQRVGEEPAVTIDITALDVDIPKAAINPKSMQIWSMIFQHARTVLWQFK